MQGVYKVYSGKQGCMCGCRGKYSYTVQGAINHNPGYDVSDAVNESGVKMMLIKLLRNPNTVQKDNMLVLEQDGRVFVAWMAK